MINVEQGALCTFKQQVMTRLLGRKQLAAYIGHHRRNRRRERHRLIHDLLYRDCLRA
jgi:hypothetical protein